ncbi:MAG: BON domain-containing protein [Gemmatimonadota bacterium]
MGIIRAFIYGMSAGAGLMYYLDPERGRRRRALVRDQVDHATHRLEDAGQRASALAEQMSDRVHGVAHESRARMREERVPDEVLVERVRAAMGRAVSNPGAIEVSAHDGTVTLSGPSLGHEARELIRTVEHVRGVRDVVNRLESHDQPGNVPGLQGTQR